MTIIKPNSSFASRSSSKASVAPSKRSAVSLQAIPTKLWNLRPTDKASKKTNYLRVLKNNSERFSSPRAHDVVMCSGEMGVRFNANFYAILEEECSRSGHLSTEEMEANKAIIINSICQAVHTKGGRFLRKFEGNWKKAKPGDVNKFVRGAYTKCREEMQFQQVSSMKRSDEPTGQRRNKADYIISTRDAIILGKGADASVLPTYANTEFKLLIQRYFSDYLDMTRRPGAINSVCRGVKENGGKFMKVDVHGRFEEATVRDSRRFVSESFEKVVAERRPKLPQITREPVTPKMLHDAFLNYQAKVDQQMLLDILSRQHRRPVFKPKSILRKGSKTLSNRRVQIHPDAFTSTNDARDALAMLSSIATAVDRAEKRGLPLLRAPQVTL